MPSKERGAAVKPETRKSLNDMPAFGFHSPWEAAAKRFQAEAARLIGLAISNWPAQAGMSEERWLDLYDLHIEATRGSTPTTITLHVTAHLKGEEQVVMPYRAELYVGDGHPRIRRAEDAAGTYLPTEDPE